MGRKALGQAPDGAPRPLTRAERQERWRTRRNAAARDAADTAAELKRIREECILCGHARDDLEEDDIVVSDKYGYGSGCFVCEPCIIEAAAKIEKRKAKENARR
jgi:hypothetical protein